MQSARLIADTRPVGAYMPLFSSRTSLTYSCCFRREAVADAHGGQLLGADEEPQRRHEASRRLYASLQQLT